MPSKIPFKVIHLSGQDDNYRGTDLNTHCPTTKGWQSQRFCMYPQDIVVQLERRARIKKIQILSHQYLIATKIEFYIGDTLQITQDGMRPILTNARFTRLGYVALSNNEKTGFRARELKSVHVDAIGCFIKFIIHKNHINKHNLFNQVGLVAINVIGDEIATSESIEASSVPDETPSKELSLLAERPDYISPLDDLAFDMYQDPDVAQVIRKLERQKTEAVAYERYDVAKRIKLTIEQLQTVGEKLGKAEVEKRQAIENEDYDRAKLKKQQMDEYRLLAYNKLRVNDLLDSSMLSSILPAAADSSVPDVSSVRLPPVVHHAGDFGTDQNDPLPAAAAGNASPQTSPTTQRYIPYDDRPLPAIRSKMRNTPRRSPLLVTDHMTMADYSVPRATAGGGNEPIESPDVTFTDPANQPPTTTAALIADIDQLSENDQREAGPLIDAFGVNITGKMYSKNWLFREEALSEIHQAMKLLDDSASRDDALLQLRGALVAFNRAIKDNVIAVFTTALSLHNMILAEFISRHRIPRTETSSFMEKTFASLLVKIGDTSVRHRDAVKTLVIKESHLPEVKATGTLFNECVRPFKLTTAPRLALSRTELISQLYEEHGFHDGGLTLPSLMSFLTHGALVHTSGEVRERAERLIVGLYETIGTPVREYLLNNCDEKTRKSVQYKQLFKAFERIDNEKLSHDGDVVGDKRSRVGEKLDREVGDKRTRVGGGGSDKRDATVSEKHAAREATNDKHAKVVGNKRNVTANNQHNTEVTTKAKNKNKTVPESVAKEHVSESAALPPATDNERVCIFCGESNEAFTDDGLDLHYWKSCPMLKRCQYCRQVVEISGLMEHLLQECENSAEFKQCPRCTEVLHSKHYVQHTRDNSCKPAEAGRSRCPLCHKNIDATELSWRSHLMSTDGTGCQSNPRLKQQPQQQSQRTRPDRTSTIKSTKSPKVNSSPQTNKVKVR